MSVEKKILLKRSSVSGSVPLIEDLDDGEIAFNTADGKIFTKRVNEDNEIEVWALPTFDDMDEQSSMLGMEILKNSQKITGMDIPGLETH